jgi:transcription antitermination factor NusG
MAVACPNREVEVRWFAIRVRPRFEKLVSDALRSKDYTEFLPVFRARRRWSDRFTTVELPLFPGYTFCRFNPERRLPILTTPGVMHVVGLGRVPIPVDDGEIAAVRAIVDSGLTAQPWPFLKSGDRVMLAEGPLRGVEGILVSADTNRLVVNVTLLQRSIAVQIDRDWVRPLTNLSAAGA